MSPTATTPLFVPGRDVIGAVKLSGNESPFPPLPVVQRAMADALLTAHRYPDNTCTRLTAALAAHLLVEPEQIAIGAGSSPLLERLFAAARTGPGDEVLIPNPAFQAFPLLAAHARIALRGVDLSPEWTVDLDAMRDAIDPGITRLVLVSNPHNPTGTAHRTAALRSFLDTVPPDVLVVLDEAYLEYSTVDAIDGVALAREYWASGRENLAVTRTFSKAHGLAGTRVGYLVAPEKLIGAVTAAANPFEVNSAALAGAVASLSAVSAVTRRAHDVGRERDRVLGELHGLGFASPPSAANHLWIPLGDAAREFEAHCLTFGCTVMTYPALGTRVTISRRSDNDLFLAAARSWRAQTAAA